MRDSAILGATDIRLLDSDWVVPIKSLEIRELAAPEPERVDYQRNIVVSHAGLTIITRDKGGLQNALPFS